ncbi:hypothetical protein JCM8097_008785 [Rhodosporidiobolus ruineniae]
MGSKRTRDSQHPPQPQHKRFHSTTPRPSPPSTPLPPLHSSPWLVWDSRNHQWTTQDDLDSPASTRLAPSPSSSPTSLSFLTYNTFSSSPTHSPLQSTAVLDLLRSARADVIALQEVTAAFFRRLQDQAWVQQAYVLANTPEGFWTVAGKDGRGPGSKPGEREACVVLVRKDLVGRGSRVELVKLPRASDEGGKAAVVVNLHSGGREQLRLFTSHFTSLSTNAPIRSAQYQLALSLLSSPSTASTTSSSSPEPLRVLLGDFNASSPSELALFPSSSLHLQDACASPSSSTSKSKKRPRGNEEEETEEAFRARPTFGHLYPWVTASSRKPRKPRRIDRVYFSAGEKAVRVKSYIHLGAAPLVNPHTGARERDRLGKGGWGYASDHEAVRVVLEIRGGQDGQGGEDEGAAEEGVEGGGGGEEGEGEGRKQRKRKKRRRKKDEGG